jgi:hypothetical protein
MSRISRKKKGAHPPVQVHRNLSEGLGDRPTPPTPAEPEVLAVMAGTYSTVREAARARASLAFSRDLAKVRLEAKAWAKAALEEYLQELEAQARAEAQALHQQQVEEACRLGEAEAIKELLQAQPWLAGHEEDLKEVLLQAAAAEAEAEAAKALAEAEAAKAKALAEAEAAKAKVLAEAEAAKKEAVKPLLLKLSKLEKQAAKAIKAAAGLGLGSRLLEGVLAKAQLQAKACALKEVHLAQVEGQLGKLQNDLAKAQAEADRKEAQEAQKAFEAKAWAWLSSPEAAAQLDAETLQRLLGRGKYSPEVSKHYKAYCANKPAAKPQDLSQAAWAWFKSHGASELSRSEYVKYSQLNRPDAALVKRYRAYLNQAK